MIDKKNKHLKAIRKKNGKKGNACLTDSIQPIAGVDDDNRRKQFKSYKKGPHFPPLEHYNIFAKG